MYVGVEGEQYMNDDNYSSLTGPEYSRPRGRPSISPEGELPRTGVERMWTVSVGDAGDEGERDGKDGLGT